MTTSKKPAFVQLQANCKVDGCVEPAQHRDEVEFYSLYLGEPGNYQWVADFESRTAALAAAHHMVMAFGCEFDRSQYDMVMDSNIQEVTPQPKGHPHAALMAEYAKDAAETETPWERWEFRRGDEEWLRSIKHPEWLAAFQYRRKPEPPKTITVNGFEVPAPVAESPAESELVWVASPLSRDFAAKARYVAEWDFHKFKRGLLHATEEAAVAHAKAMLGIDPKGDA